MLFLSHPLLGGKSLSLLSPQRVNIHVNHFLFFSTSHSNFLNCTFFELSQKFCQAVLCLHLQDSFPSLFSIFVCTSHKALSIPYCRILLCLSSSWGYLGPTIWSSLTYYISKICLSSVKTRHLTLYAHLWSQLKYANKFFCAKWMAPRQIV